MATKAKQSARWSIGLFRNGAGKLVAAYVTADGKPMPYEQKRVGRKKSLHNGVYTGMKYSEARQQLLKDDLVPLFRCFVPLGDCFCLSII